MPNDTQDKMSDDTITCLEQAKKGKPRKFVLVNKGAAVVSLVVYNKGSLETYKKEAKEAGSGQVSYGVVTGSGMELNFQLARSDGFERPPVKTTALKEYLKASDFKCQPLIEIVDAPLVVLDDKDPVVKRFLALQPAALAACDKYPNRAGEINGLCEQIGKLLDVGEKDQNDEAAAKLADLEKLLSTLGPQTTTPPTSPPQPQQKTTPPVPPPQPTQKTAPEKTTPQNDDLVAITARISALKPDLAKALAAKQPKAEDLKLQVSQAAYHARKGEFKEAGALLNQVEKDLGKSPGSVHPLAGSWETLRKEALAKLEKFAKSGPPETVQKLQKILALANTKATAGDYKQAIQAVNQIEPLLIAPVSKESAPEQPTESTAQPTESTAQPTESTAQPTESTAQPTESTAQPTESTAQPTEPSPEEQAYRTKLEECAPKVNEAIREGEWIGGFEVEQAMAQVGKLAAGKKWAKAVVQVATAHDVALAVLKRKPYVVARKAHEAKIKATTKLRGVPTTEKGGSYGEIVEGMWDEAERLVKAKYFDGAKEQINSIAEYIKKTVETDRSVSEGRAKIESDGILLETSIKDEINKPEGPDLAKLKELAQAELKRGKDAIGLGMDPGAKAREPLEPADELPCHDIFVKFGWFAMKEALKTGEFNDKERTKFTKDQMWKCWRYRQKLVTAEIDKLRLKYPTLIAKASGSEDLESDIDITFATPSSGDDVKAAKDFNAAIQKEFKKPPGRVFDVNIYSRDYGAIKESFNKDFSLEPQQDKAVDQPDDAKMQKLSQVDQDVATLLKQRRFMDGGEYQSHVDAILQSLADPIIRARTQKQFDEAEDIYFLTLQDKIEGIRKKIAQKVAESTGEVPQELRDVQAKLAELDKLRDKGDVAGYQRTMQDVMNDLEHDFPAEVMEATDEMYLDRMGGLRDSQAQIAKLQNSKADPDEHHPGVGCDDAHKGEDHDTWRKKKLNVVEVQVKKDMFTNIVFANEAYTSEGAIQHIVAGMQGTQDEKEKALKSLNSATLVQSCNEQLADFFKDMQHFTKDVDKLDAGSDTDKAKKSRQASGEAYVHASKYLFRLLDGARVLAEKFATADPPLTLDWFTEIGAAGATLAKQVEYVQKEVDGFLYQLRKCSTLEASVKGELAVVEVERLLKVKNVRQFTAKIAALGKEINVKVRAHKSFTPELTADRQAEDEFFKFREAPDATPREKSLNKLRISLLSPLDVSNKANLAAALTDLGETPDAVVAQWEACVGALATMAP